MKAAALREALDSSIPEATASYPPPRCISRWFQLPVWEGATRSVRCRCVALFGFGRALPAPGAGCSPRLAAPAPLPHIPQPGGREQLFSQGMCASADVSFGGNEAKCVIASLVPSLPALALGKAEASRVCTECALQVAPGIRSR